jgi:hypothetical protein
MVDPLVEHVQRMLVEERRGLSLDCFSLVIELEVALAEIHVCLILMPSEHELALRLNPVNRVEVVRTIRWEIE